MLLASGDSTSGYSTCAQVGRPVYEMNVDGEPADRLETSADSKPMVSWPGLDTGLDRGAPASQHEAPSTVNGGLRQVTLRLGALPNLDGDAALQVRAGAPAGAAT